ncbi:MGH1-like glycoside hydrolase domain-containing protein [Flavivirga spongiicola]|uniref:Mannosylglycerate hydrolase MGH1-like glycoside hydrolase domain-containing protein n=1 Tax=Flavivirga spongiicola TaxID=421621 RepID=A0ABU7XXB1_9FLAO|nr:hypothetical protein [Flavivirga sp. MEBiC05379]MDO5980045.1 hypothetical protein [Flavivirga sp. MEBiC05379]
MQNLLILVFLLPISLIAQKASLDLSLIKKYEYSHDLELSDWGPYSKKYNGISHITNKEKGYRFDLSLAVGFFHRSKMIIPDVIQERDYFVWDVDPSLKYLGYNYQLEWKDKVTCDVVFSEIDKNKRLISITYSNNTVSRQDVVYNLLASINYPIKQVKKEKKPVLPVKVELPNYGTWIDGMDYKTLNYAHPRYDDNLIYNAFSKGEIYGSGMVNSRALGASFAKDKGDKVTYDLNHVVNKDEIVFRYKTKGNTVVRLDARGIIDGELTFEPTSDFGIKRVKINPSKRHVSELILTSKGNEVFILDGFALVPDTTYDELKFVQEKFQPIPILENGPVHNSKIIKYNNTDLFYGILWEGAEHYQVEIHSDGLENLPAYNNRNIDVSSHFENNRGHFTDILVYGIEVMPFSKKELNGLVCVGTKAEVTEQLQSFSENKKVYNNHKNDLYKALHSNTLDSEYDFAMNRMKSVMANNLVFPIICDNEYIKHYTPGRRWNSLYTWDVGMIGIGMLEMDLNKSINILNTYTFPAEAPNAFVHHGTPAPTQIYQYLEIWNKTNNKTFLKHFYPRLKKYYQFLAGTYGSSITRMPSNLIKTWDYFYNSAGWDDYPPQRWVEHHDPENLIAPAISSTHVIRSAKILKGAAIELGLSKDIKMYDSDIRAVSAALQKYSWDEPSGYFSYVKHNKAGDVTGILRSKDGNNMNMGMDGASPIIAGACNDKQRDVIIDKLLDKNRLWTKLGISVDKKAPFFNTNAYDNETVWISHQWFFWKTLLDLGYGQEAWDLANTALKVFSDETNRTYHCWEHYTQESLLGSGWHQFSGLNAPLVNWYAAYFKPGSIYAGFDFWIKSTHMENDFSGAEISFKLEDLHRSKNKDFLVSLNKNYSYVVYLNGKEINHKRITETALLISVPSIDKNNTIRILKRG